MCTTHTGGQNSVVPDHTLEKAAIEKFLTGGFNEKSVVTQVTNSQNATAFCSTNLEL
jgi:cytochrome c6